jgi:hypothetical protein
MTNESLILNLKATQDQFMEGVDRSKERVKKTAEVFTPTHIVKDMLGDGVIEKLQNKPKLTEEEAEILAKLINYQKTFLDTSKNIIDPACGDGNFLIEVLIRRLEQGHSHKESLKTLYGVDIMPDNIIKAKERLRAGIVNDPELEAILEKNIVCADSNKYHFDFDGSNPSEEQKAIDEFADLLF